jgi:hypothetical protein
MGPWEKSFFLDAFTKGEMMIFWGKCSQLPCQKTFPTVMFFSEKMVKFPVE